MVHKIYKLLIRRNYWGVKRMKDKIFKFMQKNYGWIVAVITGISVVTSFILRFIKYMYSIYYFSYYGLSYELFNSNELGFLYNFGFSILVLLCFGSLMYCYIQLFNIKKMKLKLKTILCNIFLILISNIIIIASTNVKYSIWQYILNVIVLIIVEIIASIVFFKMDKKERNKTYEANNLPNVLKIIPFYLMLLIFLFLTSYGLNIAMNKSYRIIDNDKVIAYATNDYYLVLDCEIKDNKLTIYKGKQAKINNENIVSELINFDEVNLK